MRRLYTIICLLFFGRLFGQNVEDLDKYRLDTLSLSGISSNKVIIFKNEGLAFLVDYRDFKDSALFFAKEYRQTDKSQASKVATLLKKAKRQLRSRDTAWMDTEYYNLIGFHFVERFIASQIDKGKIAIQDLSIKKELLKIIRVTGNFIRGPLNAWSGRRYYKVGSNVHFALVTTSQS